MSKYTYKPQYGVIVICTDEKEQKATGYGGHFRAVQAFKYIGNGN